MRFLRFSAALILSSIAAAPVHAQSRGELVPPRSPRNASYSIEAKLDAATRTIAATETITWRNITALPVDDLRFHVYWNAWRDDRSTWQRERKLGRAFARQNRPGDWARVDVISVRLTGAEPLDLTPRLRFIAPDDGNADDRTVLQAPLPQPARPGQTLTIAIEWQAHVPRAFARTGAIGNYFFIAQWFPKLGVLEDGGWNCHQFHSGTEFFSDYGVYDVRLTTPRGWLVGATGVERDQYDNAADGTTTHRFYQEDVHDFAWTTSPDSLERTARFDHPTLPSVTMRLLLRPDHAGQAERHFEATRAALKYYGEWFGPYPYGHITIVDPAFESGSSGMEYPTLFTAGSRLFAPEHSDDPEDVVVHEAGHQFFYGIVGNNEFEHAWLDEGVNTFVEARVMDLWYPTWHQQRYFGTFIPYVFKEIQLTREYDWDRITGYRRNAKTDEQATPSYRYFPGAGSAITYNKTALWLHTLERWLGWPVVQRILATYFERWQFKHPKPADFFAIASEVSGRDLTPFFDQVHRSSNVFDYGIQELRSDREAGQYRTTVVARRYGEAIFPIDVRVTFTGDKHVVEHWDGRDRWRLYTYIRPERAVAAVADPERVLLLDVNVTNNSKSLEPLARAGASAATKWSLDWMVWLQNCLLSWSALV